MKKIEAIIVDGVVYDVMKVAKGCRCAYCDFRDDEWNCHGFEYFNYCPIGLGLYFKRRKKAEYNKWRRGDSPYKFGMNPQRMPFSTKEFGAIIDRAVEILEGQEEESEMKE